MIHKSLEFLLRRLRWRWGQIRRIRGPSSFSEIEVIHQLLIRDTRDHGIMIDVGAQFGESLRPFRLFNWRVLAFEPDPDPRKRASLAAEEDERVTVVPLAVSDREQKDIPFFTSEESTGISSLSAFRSSHCHTARVSVSTLAIELAQRDFDHVDFLKIDAEGYDFFVLRGFPWVQSRWHPRVILCEFEDSKTTGLGYQWNEMAGFLQALGYVVFVSAWYPIERYGIQHQWRTISRFPTTLIDRTAWGNLVAFRSESDALRFAGLAQRFSTT
jgi:FkbM family methyltransferase